MSTIVESVRSVAARDVLENARARAAFGIAAFVAAMSFSAQIAVPLPWSPVPMTLQPLVVLLAGAFLGSRGGAAAMLAYLALGAGGAPVFSLGGAGLPWLVGPTGGYLLAMPAVAWVVGVTVRPGAGTLVTVLGFLSGLAVLYAGGVAYLVLLLGRDAGSVFALGVAPFLAGDLTKVILAVGLTRRFGRTDS
ncbi:MAG: biotin transporter BioY [Gemmatimonadota bacterium]|nr:biotin transporter BioY [Gemmatimonadota bacterium]